MTENAAPPQVKFDQAGLVPATGCGEAHRRLGGSRRGAPFTLVHNAGCGNFVPISMVRKHCGYCR